VRVRSVRFERNARYPAYGQTHPRRSLSLRSDVRRHGVVVYGCCCGRPRVAVPSATGTRCRSAAAPRESTRRVRRAVWRESRRRRPRSNREGVVERTTATPTSRLSSRWSVRSSLNGCDLNVVVTLLIKYCSRCRWWQRCCGVRHVWRIATLVAVLVAFLLCVLAVAALMLLRVHRPCRYDHRRRCTI